MLLPRGYLHLQAEAIAVIRRLARERWSLSEQSPSGKATSARSLLDLVTIVPFLRLRADEQAQIVHREAVRTEQLVRSLIEREQPQGFTNVFQRVWQRPKAGKDDNGVQRQCEVRVEWVGNVRVSKETVARILAGLQEEIAQFNARAIVNFFKQHVFAEAGHIAFSLLQAGCSHQVGGAANEAIAVTVDRPRGADELAISEQLSQWPLLSRLLPSNVLMQQSHASASAIRTWSVERAATDANLMTACDSGLVRFFASTSNFLCRPLYIRVGTLASGFDFEFHERRCK